MPLISELPVYRPAIAAEWIDYNGHLRDAYYGLIFSYAIDDLMDRLGIDEAYRKSTGNTLYSLEMHVFFLREVKQSDEIHVVSSLVGADKKRLHLATALHCNRFPEAAATAEFMLLHVNQGETVKSAPFPPDVRARVDALAALSASLPPVGAASRKIELR
jgi:acyl-CoA thioester hydrolase